MSNKDLGKLKKIKNRKIRGNEKEDYLATSLEFPDEKVWPVIFLPDELERPIKRAIKKQNETTES